MANFVTLQEAKDFLVINSNTQDEMLSVLITNVSDFIKVYCGTSFIDYYNVNKTEYSNGGESSIFVTEFPIKEVSAIGYSSDYGQTYTDFTDFYVDRQNDCINSKSGIFPYSANGYRIDYTAGYPDVPKALKLACLDLIKYYKNSDNSVKSTRNVGSNTTQVEFITGAKLPSSIRIVLDQYRVIL